MDLIIDWCWQGTVLAVGFSTVADRWPRASAATRYQSAWMALILVLLLPLAQVWIPAYIAAGPDAASGAPHTGRPAGLFELDLPFAFAAALGTAWALWALRHLVAIGLAVCALRRARLASRPFPVAREQMLRTWLRCRHRMHTARLVLSDDVRGAGVLGLWTPLIGVSPAVVDRLTPEELDRIVIHEAAHVLRRDDRADCVQRAIYALVGWHPGVWWLDRRLRAEREAACDDWVVALTHAPVPYAAALVKLADLSRPKTVPQLTPGALSSSSLSVRVSRLLDRHRNPSTRASRPGLGAAAALALSIGVPLSTIDLVSVPVTDPAHVASSFIGPRSFPIGRAANLTLESTRTIVPGNKPTGGRMRQARPPRFTVTGGAPSDSTLRPDAHASEYRPPAVSDAQTLADAADVAAPSAPVAAPERSIPATSLASHEPAILPEAPRAIGPLALDMPAASSVTPWGAAADGGVAVGEGSRKAAVAAAGFFTRLSKSIGDSFDSGPRPHARTSRQPQ